MRLSDLVRRRRSAAPAPGSADSVRKASPDGSVDQLVAEGRLSEALDRLTEQYEESGAEALAQRLVDLRHAAVEHHNPEPRLPWPPVADDPFPEVAGVPPEITADQLGAEVLAGAVAHHGCLLVRGLFDADQVERTVDLIDRVDRIRTEAGDDGPSVDEGWFRPFAKTNMMDVYNRRMVGSTGGTWLADSPRGLAQVLGDLRESGAIDVIAEHFGERPVISLQKCTLRRNSPEYRFAAWHQDGSFLGSHARAMNVWVALTPCGGDRPAPGLQFVPARTEAILPCDGGTGSASIAGTSVLEVAEHPWIQPEFEPGDALMFDGHLIHRTYLTHEMVDHRYALESWFFAGSNPADRYQSFLV